MKKISILILLAIVLIGTSAVFAQQEVIIENIYLEIRPEYDRPEVLVIYTFALNEDQNYPVDLTVKIPASSGEPAVVWEVIDGAPVATTYDVAEDGDWLSVNIQTDTPVVYLDFYDPEFVVQNSSKSYTYNFPPGLISDFVELVIWQPAQTENFQSSLELLQSFPGEQGITYHVAELNVDELDGLEVEFSYDKTVISDSDGSTGIDWMGILPWVLGVFGAGILAFGLFNFSSRPKAKRKIRINPRKNTEKKGSTYCHNCGSKMSKNDKFCSECGKKVR